jgi:hypothetical protein
MSEVSMTKAGVRSAAAHVRRNRILGVAGATLAAVAVWAIEVPLLGIRLQAQFGNAAPQSIGIALVVVSALAGSLGGWGLLALLERRFAQARARTIWTGIAIAVLLVSFSAPISAGTTTTTKVALAMMHLAVAAVLIPSLRRG